MNNIYKLARSFKYVFRDMRSGFRTQLNFRVQCIAAVFAVLMKIFLDVSKANRLLIILTIGPVLSAELTNTAIDGLVDLVSHEYYKLADRIKNVAAAVTILAFNALLIAPITFTPSCHLIVKTTMI